MSASKNLFIPLFLMACLLLNGCGGGSGDRGSAIGDATATATATATTGNISGYVYAHIGGALKTANAPAGHQALAGATVTCSGTTTTTNANGYYLLSSIPTGSQTLSITKTGFGTITKTVTVSSGQTIVATAENGSDGVVTLSVSGSISVISTPTSATIYIDSVLTGLTAPQTLQGISPGTHTVRVLLDGYLQSSTQTIVVAANETTSVFFTLFVESYCGDGSVDGSEQCDDGNATTETCTYGETSCTICDSTCQNTTGATSYCGDDSTDTNNSEGCDDGNTTPADGCSSTCNIEVDEAVCGNSVLESTEQCDDGNTTTEMCTYGQSSCTVCNSLCMSASGTTSYCGDNTTDTSNNEQCDDGNTTTETCSYGATSCSVCNANCQSVSGATAYCGNSTTNIGEGCDDGNTTSGDGCSSTCQTETSTIPLIITFDMIDGKTYIFSQEATPKYLGIISSNQYASESIANSYGTYGSTYSASSIWNNYSSYGSPYSSYSATNVYTSTPPIVYYWDGSQYVGLAYLTANNYLLNRIDTALLQYCVKNGTACYGVQIVY